MRPNRSWTLVLAMMLVTVALAGCLDTAPANARGDTDPQVREIRMWVEEMTWELHPGVTTTVWAFCAEGDGVAPVHDGACGVPGPTIRVNAGDTVKLTFENTHTMPHTVHFHGWHGFDADMNGNRLVGEGMVVDAGETTRIEWVAEPAGSFIYHCHFETPSHMEKGMSGAFIVEDPAAEDPDVDHVMVLDDWAVGNATGFVGAEPTYDIFTINGKSFPLVDPILAEEGDTVRLHMVNAGFDFRAMHLHGYTPDSWEGVAGPDHAVPTDVRSVAPGQTVVMEFSADRPGIWLLHDHVVHTVTALADGNGFGAYPRGMLTVLAVGTEYHEALGEVAPQLLAAAQRDVHGGSGHDDHGHDDATDGNVTVVDMEDYVYGDEEIHVEPGTTVRWVNKDSVYHTVTWDDGSVDSERIEPGETWSYTFTEEGTYPYHCTPHAYQDDEGTWQGMVGKVIVG